MLDGLLTQGQIDEFNQNGLLILKAAYPQYMVADVQRGIYDVIGQVMRRYQIADVRRPFTPDAFDDGYNELVGMSRSLGSEVYDAVKQIPAFVRLVSLPLHESLMRQLRPGAHPGVAAGGFGIRIDNPGEERFRAQWHQEYPAQLRSMNGLVFWSSLVPVVPEIGPVEFCPGSHKEGPLPVSTRSRDSARTGAYGLMLHDEAKYLSKYQHIAPLSEPGDMIVIDYLLLHASGCNRSRRSRWSMQFRYFDFSDPVGMSYGWKGSFAAGVDFQTLHPELCVD